MKVTDPHCEERKTEMKLNISAGKKENDMKATEPEHNNMSLMKNELGQTLSLFVMTQCKNATRCVTMTSEMHSMCTQRAKFTKFTKFTPTAMSCIIKNPFTHQPKINVTTMTNHIDGSIRTSCIKEHEKVHQT